MLNIEELVGRLQAALEAIDWLGRPVFPALRPPAGDDDIKAFETKKNVQLPADYKAFLKIHNGMEGLEQYDWGIAGVSMPPTGDDFEDVAAGHVYVYKDKNPRHQAIADLAESVVIGSDFDYQVVYFEQGSIGSDDPKLRRLSIDQTYDHYPVFNGFTEFLAFVVEIYEDLLDLQGDDFSMGDLGELGGQDSLLKELASLLGGAGGLDEESSEPEQELSPEMARAAMLCSNALNKLLAAELIELVEGPGMQEAIEDYLMRKLLRSQSQKETVDSWIHALGNAREVEELYGTDEELAEHLNAAFNEMFA